jgi:hypothetical protein
MGCEFYYSGSLPDKALQEKVLQWVAAYYEEKAVFILPGLGEDYLTEYELSDSLQYPEGLTDFERRDYRHEHGTKLMEYPFNYYGVIPLYGFELEENGQFIFDRSAGGRLVRFLKLPDALGLPPIEDYYKNHKADVVVKERGYDRLIGSDLNFALLLRIINLRWWPELHVGDDYNVYRDVGKVLWDSGLVETLRDESINYQECWDLFKVEYDRRWPDILFGGS